MFLLTQAQLDEYIRRLEEAEKNIRIAEAKIAERDQRIIEVERLLDCMGKVRHIFFHKNLSTILADKERPYIEKYFLQEKSQLHKKLQECEQRLRLMELTDKTDATVAKRYKKNVHINKHWCDETNPTQGLLTSFSEL